MTKIPYPIWININDCRNLHKESSDIELKNKEIPKEIIPHIGRVIGYTAQIETFKTIAIAKEIASLRKEYLRKHLHKLLKILSNSTKHLSMIASIGLAMKKYTCINQDLDYIFSQIVEMKETKHILALAGIIVMPSYIAITEYISNKAKTKIIKELYSEIANDEKSDLETIIEIVKDLDIGEEKLAEIIEERALLLFATAAADEEMKKSIATVVEEKHMQNPEEASIALKEMYVAIDEYRTRMISKIYGESSKIIDLVKRYGLSGLAIC